MNPALIVAARRSTRAAGLKKARRPALRAPCLIGWLLAGLTHVSWAGQADTVRQQEIDRCEPGEITTWPDGLDRPAAGGAVRLVYRHAGAPPSFNEATVLGAVQRAAQAWAACGIPSDVISETAAALYPGTVVTVQWSDEQTRGNFALANVGQRQLWMSAGMFALLAQRNARHPAGQVLQMALSHEIGHFFGLMAHSRRCVDVMSYYDNGQGEVCAVRGGGSYKALPEYRALLPTACDIARCRALNGK